MNDDVFNDLGLPPLAEMDEEHEAWKEMCRRLPVSSAPLLNQIKYWGETLHRLRLADPQYDDKAYAEAKLEARA